MNKIIIMGNLCQDPELSFLPGSGTAITKFLIAVNSKKKDGTKKSTFIPVTVFGKMAEIIGERVTKGNRLLIEGSLNIDSYTNKENKKVTKTYVIANDIKIIDWAENKQANFNNNNNANNNTFNNNFGNMESVEDGEIPF